MGLEQRFRRGAASPVIVADRTHELWCWNSGKLQSRRSPSRCRPRPEVADRLCRPGLHAPDRQGARMARRRAWTSPLQQRVATPWAGRSSSTGAPAPKCSWHCLPEGRCDVVVGQPLGSGPAAKRRLERSLCGGPVRPGRPGAASEVRSLADLRGKRVGIVTGTVALSEKDHAVVRFKTREEVLDGFAAASLDAAFLDADFAAWYLHEHPQLGLRLVTGYVPRERWNMALAVRAKDAQLLVEINRALAQLAESGEIRRIYAEHGVPFHAPFTGSAPERPAPRNLASASASGASWTSAWIPPTCPIPARRRIGPGFDVELARALAERLDVKLRIEWLDVQHETAVGELLQHRCDLVFGEAVAANAVADDEELAGKVLYSRPYYGTGYVLVRRKDGPRVQSLAELKGADRNGWAPRPARSPTTACASGAIFAGCTATSWPRSRH